MTARKPPNGGKSRADEKSALSVRKHGDMRHVLEKRDFITMLVRGKIPLRPLNKKRLSLSAAEIISVMHKYPVVYFLKFSA